MQVAHRHHTRPNQVVRSRRNRWMVNSIDERVRDRTGRNSALRAISHGLTIVGEDDAPRLPGARRAAALGAGEVESGRLGLGHHFKMARSIAIATSSVKDRGGRVVVDLHPDEYKALVVAGTGAEDDKPPPRPSALGFVAGAHRRRVQALGEAETPRDERCSRLAHDPEKLETFRTRPCAKKSA